VSARSWVVYFTLNAFAPRNIDWWLGPDLPPEEATAVAASLQEFQVGENSSGNRLRAAAAAWVARHGDHLYLRALDLFIAEEQRHAAELARFLALNGHPVIRRTAGDAAFRMLRHLTGTLEMQLMVLRTAEVIGFVYYGTLRAGTRSLVLRSLCDTFLRDESAHLLFHVERLSMIRSRRSSPAMLLTRAVESLFLLGTCVAVWTRHHRALAPAGRGPVRFVRACLDVAASELEIDEGQVVHRHEPHRQGEAG
jgi:hypothetical protein